MISKLKKRESQLLSNEAAKSPLFNVEYLYDKVTTESIKYNTTNVRSLLENWENLSLDIDTAAMKAYYVLEQAYLHDNPSNIETFTHTFVENIVPKVRTGMQLRDLIRKRLGHLKSKLSTKISTKLKTYESRGKLTHSSANKAAGLQPVKLQPVKLPVAESAVDESIKAINNAIIENSIYDRIIENHKKISKRFNVDKYVMEHAFTKAQSKDLVVELCKMVDTYRLSESAKFAISIENILYLYEKNHVPYERKDILEMASNYFLTLTENVPEMITNINKVLENSNLYTKEDLEFAKILQENDHISQIRSTVTSDGIYFDEGVVDKLKSFKTKATKTIAYELKHFKLSEKKSPKSFSDVMKRAFAEDDDHIIRETPNVLGYILSIFVVATGFAIGPIAGIVSAITMAFLSIKWSREEVDEQIKNYEAHIKKVDGMIAKANKQETKDRLQEYKESLETNLEKIKERKEELKSDTEVDEENESEVSEESMIRNIALLQYIDENTKNLESQYLNEAINDNIEKIPSNQIRNLVEVSLEYPEILSPAKLESTLGYEYDNCKTLSRRSILFEAVDKLKHAENKLVVEEADLNKIALNIYTALHNKHILSEALSGNVEVLQELSFMSKLDMAREKLKSVASGLHEKEKAMSKGLDMSIENMQDAIKHSMDTENREAVIRNQLLPPASRIIKTAIVTGLAWCIHPALAAITVISTYVISKNARENERQIIIDELDVELDMCNRYIKNAEDKNDLKQIKQLLTIKKKIQYERDRLYYNMKVKYNEKVRDEHRHPDDTGGES